MMWVERGHKIEERRGYMGSGIRRRQWEEIVASDTDEGT